jgi:hypothetical protein
VSGGFEAGPVQSAHLGSANRKESAPVRAPRTFIDGKRL